MYQITSIIYKVSDISYQISSYRVSRKKVYLFKISISQAPNIPQKKFNTRNEPMDILFQKHKIRIF